MVWAGADLLVKGGAGEELKREGFQLLKEGFDVRQQQDVGTSIIIDSHCFSVASSLPPSLPGDCAEGEAARRRDGLEGGAGWSDGGSTKTGPSLE